MSQTLCFLFVKTEETCGVAVIGLDRSFGTLVS